MSLATGSMFICAGCRELVQFLMSGLSIIHCRGGKSTWSDLPNIKPTHGFNARAYKSNPCRLSRQGVSNKVSGEP
jgi:hypothetical protein